MKKLHSKKLTKQIMIIIAIITLCNFAMPKFTYAETKTEDGGKLLNDLAKFLCIIPDAVNNLLQHTFVSNNNIYISGTYKILYAPGPIFAGKIPALDINFINPHESIITTLTSSNVIDFVAHLRETGDYVYNNESIIDLGTWKGKTVSLGVRGFDASGLEMSGASGQYYVIMSERNYTTGKTYEEVTNDDVFDTFVRSLFTESDQSADVLFSNGRLYEQLYVDLNNCGMAGVYYSDEGTITYLNRSISINGSEYKLYYKTLEDNYVELHSVHNGNDYLIVIFGQGGRIQGTDTILTDETLRNRVLEDIQRVIIGNIQVDQEEFNQVKEEIKSNFYSLILKTINGRGEYQSTAAVLQPIIATWYKTLRRIALVGLLSVLLYIGIRIVMTSTSAKDKAKYKAMLKDWLVALCLLFTLHYIMSLTITAVENVNEVFSASAIGEDGEDVLASKVRTNIKTGEKWKEVMPEVIIYDVITIYTIIFTIQYIRRVVYLAFLTMIAPLITLTYPLDKIKDSKAQAFDMWIKDYVFFTLLQVVHLLLYYILVGSSIDLANEGNWVFALVTIGFLTTAEKIMKSMFGFNKSKSMGALAAGATGALVMNVINKLKNPPKKQKGKKGKKGSNGGGNGGNANPVRTAGADPLAGLRTAQGGGNTDNQEEQTAAQRMLEAYDEQMGTDNWDAQERDAMARDAYSPEPMEYTEEEYRQILTDTGYEEDEIEEMMKEFRRTNGINTPHGSNDDSSKGEPEDNTSNNNNRRKINVLKGAKAVAGKYVGPNIKPMMRTAVGGLLGGAGATIGFASGVAQGDLGKAVTGGIAGGAAGFYTGQKAVDFTGNTINKAVHIDEPIRDAVDTFREGAYGAAYMQKIRNSRFDNAFMKSKEYEKLKDEYKKLHTNLSEEQVDEELGRTVERMLNAGITDSKRMEKILRKNAENSGRFSIEKAIGYSTIAAQCPDDILYNDEKFIRFFDNLNIEITQEEIEEFRSIIIEFK